MSETAPVDRLPLFSTPEPNPERDAKHRALEDAEDSELRAYYLARIREAMRDLWRRRCRFLRVREVGRVPKSQRWPCFPKVVVTPDDARRVFERMDPPGPDDLSRNFLAGVFRGKAWQAAGRYQSQTEGSHANELKAYRWAGGNDG